MRLGLKVAAAAVLVLQAGALDVDPRCRPARSPSGRFLPPPRPGRASSRPRKGFFAANGVEMDTVSIGVSPGMQAVAAGSLNIMHNTCNAVVSFIEMGGRGVHLSLVSMAIHPGVVVGKKGLRSASELKGKVVGTSSIKSGSTILLRRLLKARGLAPSDYDWLPARAARRFSAGCRLALSMRSGWCRRSRHRDGGRLSRHRHLQGSGAEVPVRLLRHQRRLGQGQHGRGARLRQGVACRRGMVVRPRQSRRSAEAFWPRRSSSHPTSPPRAMMSSSSITRTPIPATGRWTWTCCGR